MFKVFCRHKLNYINFRVVNMLHQSSKCIAVKLNLQSILANTFNIIGLLISVFHIDLVIASRSVVLA